MDLNCRQWQVLASLISVFVLFSGCSSTQVIPEEGKSTLEIYKEHMRSESNNKLDVYRLMRDNRRNLDKYTRTERNELKQLFPTLPNPELVMYVFPHITTKGRPVPGYTTAFRMYEKEQFALPGEIPE